MAAEQRYTRAALPNDGPIDEDENGDRLEIADVVWREILRARAADPGAAAAEETVSLDRDALRGALRRLNDAGLVLRRKKLRLGLVSFRSDDAKPGYGGHFLERAEAAIRALGHQPLVLQRLAGVDPQASPGPSIARVRSAPLDALILHGIQDESYISELATLDRPIIVCDYRPQLVVTHSVVNDSLMAGYQAGQRLVQLGHRRIRFVGQTRRLRRDGEVQVVQEPDSVLLEFGLRLAMDANGVPWDPSCAIYATVPSETGPEDPLIRRLFEPVPPTALVVDGASSTSAMRTVIVDPRLNLPRTTSLVGFTGSCYPVEQRRHLSHFLFDEARMADLAVAIAVGELEGAFPFKVQQIVAAEFVDNGTLTPAMEAGGHGL